MHVLHVLTKQSVIMMPTARYANVNIHCEQIKINCKTSSSGATCNLIENNRCICFMFLFLFMYATCFYFTCCSLLLQIVNTLVGLGFWIIFVRLLFHFSIATPMHCSIVVSHCCGESDWSPTMLELLRDKTSRDSKERCIATWGGLSRQSFYALITKPAMWILRPMPRHLCVFEPPLRA